MKKKYNSLLSNKSYVIALIAVQIVSENNHNFRNEEKTIRQQKYKELKTIVGVKERQLVT